MTPATVKNTPTPTKRHTPLPHARQAEGITGGTSADEAAARAAGMLPAELLQPDEIIVLLLKPNVWFILLVPIRTLLTIVVLTMVADATNTYLNSGYSRQNLLLITAAAILLRLFWQFLEWLSRVYVLTDKRVIAVAGVVRVRVFQTPLEQVQHTNLLFSLRERLFGLGTIAFATAGTAATEAYWLMLADPLQVHQKIVQTISRYRR